MPFCFANITELKTTTLFIRSLTGLFISKINPHGKEGINHQSSAEEIYSMLHVTFDKVSYSDKELYLQY